MGQEKINDDGYEEGCFLLPRACAAIMRGYRAGVCDGSHNLGGK